MGPKTDQEMRPQILRQCQRPNKEKKIWTGSNNWSACYLKVTELILSCGSLGHTVTKVKANIYLMRIYSVLWQTGG